jgi:hypothetical protein
MRTLGLVAVVVLVAVALTARAGEIYLGTIYSYDGGVTSNRYSPDGGFPIGFPSRVSIQCNADVCVCTDRDRAACTCTTGVQVSSGVLFPTSVDNSSNALSPTLSDGGFTTVGGGLISIFPVTTTAAATCDVFGRSGRE